ncbi:MAG: EAL domain-containing protein [Pseudomonadales bacterium]
MYEPVTRILLLGSELADYRRLEEMLSSIQASRYQLLWCEQWGSSYDEVMAGSYDVILLDCQYCPDIALNLLQRVIDGGYKLPIIALADSVDCIVGQQALSVGAADFLALENLDAYILKRCIGYAMDKRDVDHKLSQLNLYDPLTGIPNRMLFLQTMERAIEAANTQQIPLALLLINLDDFKKINESYGSEAGDRLVTTMAQRLTHCVRKNDSVARVDGDEFTLVLDDYHDQDDVALVAKKVIDVLSAPFTVAGHSLVISCSIGVAIYPAAGDTVDGLLKRANIAMLDAKAERGSQYQFYSEASNADVMWRINMEADLRRAIRNNEFELYYQPRVNLESGDTVGMEALIRWPHPTRGMVSPQEFIPVAEECGLIVPIGYWVIQQACEDIMIFDEDSNAELDISINLSFKQLQDNMFVDTATRIIKQSGVDASRLEFELTETAIMSNFQQTYEGMMALSKLGSTFSLDDFGTGFSSFAHIQRLPIAALKVDRSFIRNVVQDSDDAIIVKAMIGLAHSLRLKVIAEGVETLDQVQFLWQNRCDEVQGFYFSPAVPAKDFSLMINQRATAVM